MMLPLTAKSPGDRWPSSLDVTLSDGRDVRGTVGWIETAAAAASRRWTEDPRRLRIRAINPNDDSTTIVPGSSTGPFLLAEMPGDASGEVRLGKQRLNPVWIERLTADPLLVDGADHVRPSMHLSHEPDRPDPDSPLEYWRWVLLADRLGYTAGPPSGEPSAQLAAQYVADLWRWSLARLHRLSPRIARQCRDRLTHTCIDRRQPFAAWIADPSQPAALLGILLDDRRTDAAVLADAVAWLDSQHSLMLWPAGETTQAVQLYVVTSSPDPMVAQVSWRGQSEPPALVQLDPGVLMKLSFDRLPPPSKPALGLRPPPEPSQHVLEVRAGPHTYKLAFAARPIPAQPPHVQFALLSPPLTLAEAQARTRAPITSEPATIAPSRSIPVERATLVQVRRLGGRWEVFFECRRPKSGSPPARAMPDQIRLLEDLRGIEAVTVVIGPDEDENIRAGSYQITVPEEGWTHLAEGLSDPTLQVHKKAFDDRWYCRIVLPQAWFSAAEVNPVLVGFVRSHGDSPELETGPAASVPWRCAPGRIAVDLGHWDELPLD